MNPVYPFYGEKTVCKPQKLAFPPQHQDQRPGLESLMVPEPISEDPAYIGDCKLKARLRLLRAAIAASGERRRLLLPKKVQTLSSLIYMNEPTRNGHEIGSWSWVSAVCSSKQTCG